MLERNFSISMTILCNFIGWKYLKIIMSEIREFFLALTLI